MNDPLEKLLKKMELSCYGKESDLIYRGDALNAIRGACIMAHIPFNSSSPEGRRTMEAIKSCLESKKRLHLFARRLEKRQDRTATVVHRR